MMSVIDYFFSPHATPQQRRLRCVARNGVQHASEISPRDPAPGQPITLHIITDAALPIAHVAAYYTSDGAGPAGACGVATAGAVALAEREPGEPSLEGETRIYRWRAIIPAQPDGVLVRYRIDAWSDGAAQRWQADALDPSAAPTPAGREFAYHVDQRQPPAWTRDAIIYHIFVDRFAAASDQPPLPTRRELTEFFGGSIRGITEKLDYLADLGVNCLWLSPVMESPTYHGYNPSSYHSVSPRYGTNDDLRALIAAAHARGMRVLLDFVANHTSNEHPAFIAARNDESAPTRQWYDFDLGYRSGYRTFYDVADMPVLQTSAEPVRRYLIDAARHWLTDLGADGLRLDNVSGPTHAFWTFFQEGVKAANAEALTLGEISGDMDDIASYAGRLDACMDFPLARMIRQTFALREATLDALLTMLTAHEAAFPASLGRARLLDNHDMHRFMWLAHNDTRRLTLALAFLLAIPGTPIIYYGAEVGLSQRDGPHGKDAYAREPMLWGADQQADVLARARWLIHRRIELESLRRGRLERVPLASEADEPAQVGALARWTDAEATVVIFNNGEQPARFALERERLAFMGEEGWAGVQSGQGASAWLLSPDDLSALETPSWAGTLPPLSAMLIVLRAGA